MTAEPLEKTLFTIVSDCLTGLGYDLVRLKFSPAKHRATLQIMAEPSDGRRMSVEDCANISRNLAPVLEVADPIATAYNLEVSSPGIDRPLTKAEDFTRFQGLEAKLTLKLPHEGRKRFQGIIGAAADTAHITIKQDDTLLTFAFADISDAKLVLTDALLKTATWN